jgi:hypothetical protein
MPSRRCSPEAGKRIAFGLLAKMHLTPPTANGLSERN